MHGRPPLENEHIQFSRTFIRRLGLYTHAGAIGFMEVAGSLQLYFQNGYI